MIECSSCGTSQFLQITESRVAVYGDGRGLRSVREFYSCTLCGGTGELVIEKDQGSETITGTVRRAEDMEVTV